MQLEASENEIKALVQLIDAGVRQLGLGGVEAATFWKRKIDKLLTVVEAPKEEIKQVK